MGPSNDSDSGYRILLTREIENYARPVTCVCFPRSPDVTHKLWYAFRVNKILLEFTRTTA